MSRSEQILKLRPEISVQKSDGVEAFQNATLRPILKLQHPLTQAILHQHSRYSKMLNAEMPKDIYHKKVLTILRSDLALRQMVIGTIIGLMTVEEYSSYDANTKEYNRRIITMQAKRYADTQYPNDIG